MSSCIISRASLTHFFPCGVVESGMPNLAHRTLSEYVVGLGSNVPVRACCFGRSLESESRARREGFRARPLRRGAGPSAVEAVSLLLLRLLLRLRLLLPSPPRHAPRAPSLQLIPTLRCPAQTMYRCTALHAAVLAGRRIEKQARKLAVFPTAA